MSGTTRSSEGLDERRRRLLFRAWHRGIREVDLIMGGFADAHIAALSEAEVDDFERLMDVQEHELLGWVTGAIPTPDDFDSALFRRLRAFHHGGTG
jgi:antitoxin CptB